jgi:hypothetical protein
MAMPWFRMHHEARTDAKLRTLADDEFRVWFNLLCYAAEQDNRGRIECADDFLLAIEVAGGDQELMVRVLHKLARLRIICWDGDEDDPGDTLTFINFDDRNYDKPSDHPDRVAERVRRHRAKNETPDDADETPTTKEVTPLKRDVTPSNDPDKIRVEEIREDKTRQEERKERTSASPSVRADPLAGFDAFYDAYPRKTARQAAEKAWRTLHPNPELVSVIMAALDEQKTWPQWQEGVVPHPATWINGKRWTDQKPARASPNGQHVSPQERKRRELMEYAEGKPL